MVEVEGGCWQAQMMTNEAAGLFVLHTDTLRVEAAQATLPAGSLCRPSHCCWPWSCSDSGRLSGDAGPH